MHKKWRRQQAKQQIDIKHKEQTPEAETTESKQVPTRISRKGTKNNALN